MAAAADADSRRAALEAVTAAPERGGGSCVLCCGDLETTALGRCDHPVCYRCSTKMRVLCEQRYCAVCREELRQVVFGKKLPAFATIAIHQLQHEKKYDIYFADGRVFALYRQLLQHECPRCPELPPFSLFGDLEQHMRKQHELFCCKLCLKYLKIFTYERKWYSRKDLARHRMQGDPDDTSHRGHPLCKFCDERYLDNDELLKHLRRDHYFCHFCDSDGAQDYYSDYAYLREHFREKHFLCEEGRCSTEQFTHAFRTEIDLKAHKTACHSRSRAEARQNRQIDLQFSYTPRHSRRNEGIVSGEDYEEVDRYNRQGRAGRTGSRGSQQSRRGSWRYKREEEDREVAAAIRASVAMQQKQETHRSEDREEGGRLKKEEAGVWGPEEPRGPRRLLRAQGEGPGPKEASADGPISQEAFPASSPAAGATLLSSRMKISPVSAPPLPPAPQQQARALWGWHWCTLFLPGAGTPSKRMTSLPWCPPPPSPAQLPPASSLPGIAPAARRWYSPPQGLRLPAGAVSSPGRLGRGLKAARRVGHPPWRRRRRRIVALASPPRSYGACPLQSLSLPCWHWPLPRPSPKSARRRRWALRSWVLHHPCLKMLGPLGLSRPPWAEPRGQSLSSSMDTQRGQAPFGVSPRNPLGSHGPWGPSPAPHPRKTSQRLAVAPAHPGCPLPQASALWCSPLHFHLRQVWCPQSANHPLASPACPAPTQPVSPALPPPQKHPG
ncbi:E3 ubiquitin-protein ligase ZNF598 isoform X7 [Desmodus rotundus]|uniref:E3 ubiquitin-protein ligase ZNF598 isoform X7 n=1 Tax=Desmodus rotundus TaxID=9430 RepID=UPI001E1BF576|nr:E3 ubiquitin-protein ligase ZNF598 isoform X7 [Desmodus rotundus]